MRKPSGTALRWGAPVALATAAIVVLLVGPVFAGRRAVTIRKVNKTIVSKTNATELRLAGSKDGGDTFDYDNPTSLMASLTLPKAGSYVVTSTFTLLRDQSGLAVGCKLLAGGREDAANAFGGTGQLQDNVGMSVAGRVPKNGKVELRCVDGAPATDSTLSHIEITALKVPKVTLKSG